MSNPVTIIMIEDDEGHARLIERNIRRSGVNNEIIPFTNGTAALNYLYGNDGSGLEHKGNALLILNQEVRAPIYRFLRGVAFVDAGNVFESNSQLNPSKLKVGYGIGLRFHTPFSVFRIDLGFPGDALAVRGSDGSIQMRRRSWYLRCCFSLIAA
jgi:hypothetical protein